MEKLDEKKIKEIAKKYNLKLLLLFGSQVSGKTHKMSDYDFGCLSKKEVNYFEKGSMDVDLSRMVKGEAEYVDLKNAGALIKYEILKNNIILYQEPGVYADFFTRTLQDYFESRGLFEARDRVVAHKINELKKIYAK